MIDARDEVAFWLGSPALPGQLVEHALFIHLGIEEPGLKQRALDVHQRTDAARAQYAGLDDRELLSVAARQTQAIRQLNVACLDAARLGWIGWLWPLFLEHTLAELDYFVTRVWGAPGNPVQKQPGVTCENLRFLAEHAAFAAQLLDPTEGALIDGARAAEQNLLGLGARCAEATQAAFRSLSEKAARDLDSYLKTSGIGTPKVRSIVHPVLAAHVVREGERSIQAIKAT